MTMVSRCGVVSYIAQIDYKQLLDLNYMLGGLISYWASFRVRKPRQYSVNGGLRNAVASSSKTTKGEFC
ncbi:unnamed protein product, partial [marine sediment metagenome]